jgi:hypothetical protein
MDKEKIVSAFDAFVDEKYADSEEILRKELKQAVNDFLKDKLKLKGDPIQSPEADDNTGDTGDTDQGDTDEE